MDESTPSVADARAAFFARTRRLTAFLYLGSAAAAVGLGIAAVRSDPLLACGAMLGGVATMVGLTVLGAIVALPARATRVLIVAGAVLGVVLSSSVDLDRFDPAVVLGAGAGLAAGLICAIAWMRRRLAHDDELLARQIRLGYDPANPWSFLRGGEGKAPKA